MAILNDIEVRVVSKSRGKPLQEYDSPKKTDAVDQHTIEKFIEATTGEDFAVEVFVKKGYTCKGAWGLRVGINIDGGVVKFAYSFSSADVKETQLAGKRLIIFDSVPHSEGSVHSEIGFRFGSLTIDESIDTTQEDLNTQAATLGTIRISVQRVDRKPLSSPRPRVLSFYHPPEAFSVAKELIKDRHVGTVMQPGESKVREELHLKRYEHLPFKPSEYPKSTFRFCYRSEMHLQLLGCIPKSAPPIAPHQVEQDRPATLPATVEGEDSSNTVLVKPEIKVERMADSAGAMVPRVLVPPSDAEEIAKKFERLEKQLKESQEQLRASRESQDKTNALMQSVMGG
ncbi:MAG: hypothetical protein Q9224_004404, partial [Gallowayella concinna]